MPNMNDTMERVATRAKEVGVYLPLGAYARVRDEISDLSGVQLGKVYKDLVGRGQQRVRPLERVVRRRADQVESDTRRTARKTARRASTTTNQVAPKLPRVGTPKSAREVPISGYGSLTAEEVVLRLRGLTQSDLARVYKYEKAHDDRSTILEAIDSRLVELPIPTYDALTVDEITGRLDALDERELKAIKRYEEETKGRSTIIDRIDSKLA